MDLFKRIKENLPLKEVVTNYGIAINRSKMCHCPFHKDNHPSMKINKDYYYCYSCNRYGDAVNFVAAMDNISQYEAAKKIISDFGLDIQLQQHQTQLCQKQLQLNKEKELRRAFLLSRRDALFVLHRYMDLLYQARQNFAPSSPEDLEHCHTLYVEAIHMLPLLEYIDDELTNKNEKTQMECLENYGGTIENVRNRLQELNQL